MLELWGLEKMSLTICRYESKHDLIKLDSRTAESLTKFEVEQTEVSLTRNDLKKLIKEAKTEGDREVYEQMLSQLGKDEAGDFLIG